VPETVKLGGSDVCYFSRLAKREKAAEDESSTA